MILVDDEQNITNALKRELFDSADQRSIEILATTSVKIGLNLLETHDKDTALSAGIFSYTLKPWDPSASSRP